MHDMKGVHVNNRLPLGDRSALSRSGLQGNVVDYLFENSLRPGAIDRPYLRGPAGDHSFGELYERVCQAGHFREVAGRPARRSRHVQPA